MKKADIIKKIQELKSPQVLANAGFIALFAIVFTGILVSKYLFLQTIVDIDNTSKVRITAPKNIDVIDTIKTEKRKREAANKVSPIYVPADSIYIKNNLNEIIENILEIRKKNTDKKSKQNELENLFDIISDSSLKQSVFSFCLEGSDNELAKVFQNSENTLEAVLQENITEKDFEENTNNISKIIRRNVEPGTTNSHIKVITALLEQVIVPNMLMDEDATALAKKNARDKEPPVIVSFKKDEVIVDTGELITQVKREALSNVGYNILRINYAGVLCIFGLVGLGIFSVIFYLKFFESHLLNRRHLAIVASLCILIALMSVFLPNNWSVFALPLPFFSIMLSVFLNPRSSFFITVTILAIITLSLQFSALAMSVFLLSLVISIVGMNGVRYSQRFGLIKVGLYTSIAMAIIILCVYHDLGLERMGKDIAAGIINGFVSGVFALGMIPIIENTFKVITAFGLAELGDYNQPLLKRLHETAPGTFEHSLRVSNLAETAAEAIGADPVLARVGSLYHDVGKMVRPLFFVENQTYSGIENPHDKLTPRSSKMVITSHTKDGVALAKEYHIPEVIQEFIARHHGDSLTSYFYNQAVAQEGAANVQEEQFRYTGPRPNSKETAILMIADAVEAASRTLKDHTQEELDNLINKIIKDILNDNQLDDSPLTLKDIKIIAATLSRVLRSVFHKRIKYQEAIEDIKNREQFKQE